MFRSFQRGHVLQLPRCSTAVTIEDHEGNLVEVFPLDWARNNNRRHSSSSDSSSSKLKKKKSPPKEPPKKSTAPPPKKIAPRPPSPKKPPPPSMIAPPQKIEKKKIDAKLPPAAVPRKQPTPPPAKQQQHHHHPPHPARKSRSRSRPHSSYSYGYSGYSESSSSPPKHRHSHSPKPKPKPHNVVHPPKRDATKKAVLPAAQAPPTSNQPVVIRSVVDQENNNAPRGFFENMQMMMGDLARHYVKSNTSNDPLDRIKAWGITKLIDQVTPPMNSN